MRGWRKAPWLACIALLVAASTECSGRSGGAVSKNDEAGASSGGSLGEASGSSSCGGSGSGSGGSGSSSSSGATSSSGVSGSSSGGSGSDAGQVSADAGSCTPVDGGPSFSGPTVPGTVTVARGMTVGHVGDGFLGFSFEKTHMTDGFFGTSNAALVALFKLLGPGVLRIGANDVDRTTWAPASTPVSGAPFPFTVGTVEVDALADFLNATGWTAIYGLNFKTGTPSNDADEATYVANKLGGSLAAFEIGNEIDRGPPTYTAALWQSFASAIKAAVPNARFAGPATDPLATAFAATFASDQAGQIGLLTHHYYSRNVRTQAGLLSPDPMLTTILQAVSAAASSNHVANGFRIGECNTFNGHGVPGVSDALASALWALDFFFTSAINGSAGINFHGGKTGMDGTKPFLYSPIAEGGSGITGVSPLYYGMLLMSRAGTGDVLATTASAARVNFTAYAVAHAGGATAIVLDNKDPSTGVRASVDVGAPLGSAAVEYLQGASLTATIGVTFAGAEVSPAGDWCPNPPYALAPSGSVVDVLVPPASAALVLAQ